MIQRVGVSQEHGTKQEVQLLIIIAVYFFSLLQINFIIKLRSGNPNRSKDISVRIQSN